MRTLQANGLLTGDATWIDGVEIQGDLTISWSGTLYVP